MSKEVEMTINLKCSKCNKKSKKKSGFDQYVLEQKLERELIDDGWMNIEYDLYCPSCGKVVEEKLNKEIDFTKEITFHAKGKLAKQLQKRFDDERGYVFRDNGEVTFEGFLARILDCLDDQDRRDWMEAR